MGKIDCDLALPRRIGKQEFNRTAEAPLWQDFDLRYCTATLALHRANV
jgi:hypothetical protein